MAIQFTDFSKAPLLDSAAKNIFEDVLKGYKMSQEPAKMKEEQSARQLANQLKGLEVEHKPTEYELDDKGKMFANALKSKALEHYDEKYGLERDYKQSQINKNNQPPELKGNLARLMALRRSLDPNDENYQRDLDEVTNAINKTGQANKGIQISNSPDGGFEVSIGGQSEGAKMLGLPGLKKGETYLFDENKTPIGIGKPYTEAEKKEHSGREAFNIWQEFITNAQAPYSGQGASRQFENDLLNYTNDSEAKSRVDNLLAADKLLFSTTVKEEATLGGANTNQAYNRITHSLENSEIYPILKKLAKYQLPQGYSKASSDIFKQKVNEGTEAGQKVPAYKPYYFNKQSDAKNNNLSNALNNDNNKQVAPEIIKITNGVAMVKYAGETYKIPEKLVDKFMIEHSPSTLGGQYERQ